MVTIKQIAQAAGISPSTVSIVLGGKAAERKISPETQRRILDTAAAMGYQPNIAARSLRGGTGADELQLAMFWAQDFRASMMVRFWDGLRKALEGGRRPIRLAIYPYDNDRLCEARALTSASDCHAAIICNASYKDLQFLKKTRPPIPVVLYNRSCEGYCSVNVDDAAMGALAARALIGEGCKKAAVLTGPPAFEGMEVRTRGFVLNGGRHGMDVTEIYYCENSVRGGYQALSSRLAGIWQGDKLPQGLFCGSAMIAHGAIRALWDAGLPRDRWPKLVAVGNGTQEYDESCVPSLSVVQMPMEQMAGECLLLLLELMEGKLDRPISRMLELTYIPRETCGGIRPQPLAERADG